MAFLLKYGRIFVEENKQEKFILVAAWGFAAYVTFSLFNKPMKNGGDTAGLMLLTIFVVLPMLAILKSNSITLKKWMLAYMGLWVVVVSAPTSTSSYLGEDSCYTEWDGRNNPEVCE